MDTKSRWITVGLALAAATSFALAVQTAWWGVAEVAFGPFGARHCFGAECRETGLSWIGGSDLWMRSAVATRAAGYIAMFVLLMFAGAIAAKREPTLVARGCLAAIVTAIATGAYFFFGYPGVAGASIAGGFYFYVVAIVAGVAAIVLFLRRARR
jgi:hypothetical protein